jgi:iron complex outermembrane receptor protein
MMPAFRFTLLLAASLVPFASVRADADGAAADQDMLHGGIGRDIIVTAPFARERFALPTAVGVLEGTALVRDLRPTIGETLARQPGVSASFFGPNSSRPILRGLDAERVRILTDGIGSFDVSNTSADHAVAINPLTADRVEVVRGPAALLFGSSAIGGVVNVSDRRIPRELPDEAAHLDFSGTLGSAARERSLAGAVDVPLGGSGLVVHADGSYLKTGDYRVGGFVYSDEVRAAADAIGGEVAEEAQARGRVDNSDAETWEIAGGAAWIGDGGSFGVSVSRLESNYGIPARFEVDDDDHEGEDEHEDEDEHEEEGHGHAGIRLDMRQTRLDARAEIPLFGGFERLNFRFGWADYRHDEVEPSGEIGTSFFNEALEGRLELVQRDREGWKGASGVQLLTRRFEAVGEEAYIPVNSTTQLGLFTVQTFALGAADLELGGRYEHSEVASAPVGVSRRFDAVSGSAGVSVPLGESVRVAASLSYSERAPAGEELFANGAHAATETFEIGDPNLAKERSLGVELVLRGRGEGWRLEASGFFNRFQNFIYLAPTGDEEEGLPVFVYLQDGARHFGLEVDAGVRLFDLGDTRVEVTGLLDLVRADILGGGGPVPRIPPLRLIGGVEASGGAVGGRLEVEHATRQGRIAAFETATPAWTMVNASVSWKPFGADRGTTIVASANNIFDVDARRHSSLLKDFAPLPGRDFRLSARFSF